MRRLGGQSTPNSAKKIIAITRPLGKGNDTAEFVESLGWTSLIFHTVELKPLEAGKVRERLRDCLKQGPVDWVVFMSSAGAKIIFDSLESGPTSPGFSHTTRFLAVGPRTREVLERRAANQVYVPKTYSSAGVAEFLSHSASKGQRVVLVRSASADDLLSKLLTSIGMKVRTISVYESVVPRDLQSAFSFLEGLSTDRFSAVLFTSAISVSNLFRIAGTKPQIARVIELLKRVQVGAIGPATAKELGRYGIDPILPNEYVIESSVSKLVSVSTPGLLATVVG